MRLYNTDGRKIQAFYPLKEGKVGLYCCGPTVYDYAHIGNLRAYTVQDLLRRTLAFLGYSVKHVMNITDIGHLTDDGDRGEDKMLLSARKRKMTAWEVAAFYTEAFHRDRERLNILKPDVCCRATDHIEQMITMIETLEKRGYTYRRGGNVYYDTKKFPHYGRMALLTREEGPSHRRVPLDVNKKNPEDFVLWFTESKFERQVMKWDSPWGEGYPGWHIECSAMSTHFLGNRFDIHCGGVDHVRVHHTNEIAQTEGSTGKKWINYWVHSEFLIDKGEKLAKSRGNFLTLQDLIDKGYASLDYRYFLLGSHYRSQQRFSLEALNAARSARQTLVRRTKAFSSHEEEEEFSPEENSWLGTFRAALEDDLNTPRALASLWGILKDKSVSENRKKTVVRAMDGVLGLSLFEVKGKEEKDSLDEASKGLLAQRESARKEGDFRYADKIRDILKSKGIVVIDSSEGVRWRRVDSEDGGLEGE